MGKTIIFCCVAALWACGPPPPFGKTLTLHDDYFQGTVTLEKVTQLDKYRLRIENITNSVRSVRDDRGLTPFRYQPGYLEPIGRTIELSFRKLF